MANLTEDRNHTETQEFFCTTGFYGTYQKLIISALNITLSITAFLGNLLIIVALQKVSSLHLPSKLLLSSLAFTDLCVGLITQPLFVAYTMSPEHSMLCYYLTTLFNSLSVILGGVSLSTLSAISVDRLLALLLGLRYRQVVTFRRAQFFVVISWVCSITTLSTSSYNVLITQLITCVVTMLSIVTSTFSYTKIYLTLRNHQVQVHEHAHQGQPNGGGMPLNITQYRKTVSTSFWVQIALVACYLPYAIVAIFVIAGLSTQFIDFAWELTICLVMLNSSLNPFLYCWKIREVRQAVMDTLRMFCCFST